MSSLFAQNFSITNYTTSNSTISSNNITTLKSDNTGKLWVGTASNGISQFNGSTWTNYTTSNGLISNEIKGITADPNGNIWIATNAGLSKYNGATFTNYTTAQGLPTNNLRCVFVDAANNVWIGTTAGVSKYNGTSFTNYTTADGLLHNTVLSITQDLSGNMWFATATGINKFNGSTWANHTNLNGVNTDGDQVQSIKTDVNGNIWAGSLPSMGIGGGLYKWDGSSWTTYTTSNGLANNDVRGIASDKKGRMWIATNGNGSSHYHNGVFTTYGTGAGLVSANLTCIEIDNNGYVWIGSNGGVSKLLTLVFNGSTSTPSHCGNNDGTLTLNVGSINGTVYFSSDNWATITTNNTFNNLSAGPITIFFSDSSVSAAAGLIVNSSDEAMDAISALTYNLCEGDSMLPGVNDSFTNCVWEPSSVVSNANIPNPLISPPSNMWVFITYTDTNGCSGKDSIQFFIKPVPTIYVNITNDSVFTSPLIFHNYQWFLYGDTIPGATGQSYTATQPGIYMLCANNNGQCVGCSDPINYQNEGIDENKDWAHIYVYDNIFYWTLPSEGYTIKVFSLEGKLLQYFIATSQNGSVSIKDNIEGTVLIQIQNKERNIWKKLFIK